MVFSDNIAVLLYLKKKKKKKKKKKRAGRFADPQCGSSASSALGGVLEYFSGAPVHHGGEECGGRFREFWAPSGPWLRKWWASYKPSGQ